MDEDIGRKERTLEFYFLAILPDALDFVGRHERFDLTDIEQAADRLFAPGHGVEGEPAGGLFGGSRDGRLERAAA